MSDALISVWGRLGQDPKAIDTSSGKPMTVASLAVAIGSSEKEETLWLGVVAFGGLAEILAKHAKGDTLSVSGRLQRRTWTDRDGAERQDLRVIADAVVSARAARPGARGGSGSARVGGPPKATSRRGADVCNEPAPYDDPLP